MAKYYWTTIGTLAVLGIAGAVYAKITPVEDYEGLGKGSRGQAWDCTVNGYYNEEPEGFTCNAFPYKGTTCYRNCHTNCNQTNYPYTSSTDCETAGGVVGNSCEYNGVTRYTCSCPSNYVTCENNTGIGTACTIDGGNKYASCAATGSCAVGSILFSDGNCYADNIAPSGLTAKAVVYDPVNKLAVDLTEVSKAWMTGGNYSSQSVNNPYNANETIPSTVEGSYSSTGGSAYMFKELLNIFNGSMISTAKATVNGNNPGNGNGVGELGEGVGGGTVEFIQSGYNSSCVQASNQLICPTPQNCFKKVCIGDGETGSGCLCHCESTCHNAGSHNGGSGGGTGETCTGTLYSVCSQQGKTCESPCIDGTTMYCRGGCGSSGTGNNNNNNDNCATVCPGYHLSSPSSCTNGSVTCSCNGSPKYKCISSGGGSNTGGGSSGGGSNTGGGSSTCSLTGCSANETTITSSNTTETDTSKGPTWSRVKTTTRTCTTKNWDCASNSSSCTCNGCTKTNQTTTGCSDSVSYAAATCAKRVNGSTTNYCLKGILLKNVGRNETTATTISSKLGSMNTQKIAALNGQSLSLGGNSYTIYTPAAQYCASKTGKYFLPTAGDLRNIAAQFDAVNSGLTAASGTAMSANDYMWSSTQGCNIAGNDAVCNQAYKVKMANTSSPETALAERSGSNKVRCVYYYGTGW